MQRRENGEFDDSLVNGPATVPSISNPFLCDDNIIDN